MVCYRVILKKTKTHRKIGNPRKKKNSEKQFTCINQFIYFSNGRKKKKQQQQQQQREKKIGKENTIYIPDRPKISYMYQMLYLPDSILN